MRHGTAVFLAILLGTLLVAPAFAQDKADALELYRLGKYLEAIKVCQEELAESPKNIDSHVVLGWSQLKLKRYAEAVQTAVIADAISPHDPRVVQITGEARYYLGRIEEALVSLEEYVRLRPAGDRIARVYWLMGECFISLKEYQNADIAITTALYLEQNNAGWWARLGYARELANDLALSREAFDRALKLDPNLTDAQRGKERVEKKLGG
jgi:tetratricopeptide (TPR) repeat protein